MLAIYNFHLGEVKQLFKIINHHLFNEHHIFIELLNDSHSSACVVHLQRLNGLNLILHTVKASESLDLFCAPHSKCRDKPSFFLYITSPFHSKNLAKAPKKIFLDAVKHILEFNSQKVLTPKLITEDGHDLTKSSCLTEDFINQIFNCSVNWKIANDVSPVTHMIAIGPVGTSGIGGLTYLIKWWPILNFGKDCFIKQFKGDSHKPWDRCKSDGSTFDLLDMTYVDVVNCFIEFNYIKHQQHCVNITLSTLWVISWT
ncbi:beta subunit of fatty acid synthetase [Entomophthora muscae]|uniref:Beta subunit of fatty acid synthetase n=1 Tax=Entomophthora muscae TaxID=34485 RepID=A0ACC2UHP1_9FUNG|nr:beta subunit of fatty acid synthetase [Entomophthora muscae]